MKTLTEDRNEYSPTQVNVESENVIDSQETAKKAVMQMKNGRPPGPEEIPVDLVKNGTKNISEALTWFIPQWNSFT